MADETNAAGPADPPVPAEPSPDHAPGSAQPDASDGGDSPHRGDGTPRRPGSAETELGGLDKAQLNDVTNQFAVINNHYSFESVRADSVSIGSQVRRLWRAGQLTSSEARHRLTGFVEGPGFGQLVLALDHHRLLVLLGKDGSGRAMTALALISRGMGADDVIHTLTPTLTAAELAAHAFVPGRRYLLVDHMHSCKDAEGRHALETLRQKLSEVGASLVITTQPGSISTGRGAWTATLEPPTAEELLTVWTALLPDPDDCPPLDAVPIDQFEGRPGALRRAFEDLLADPDDLRRSALGHVEGWFSSGPTARQVCEVAVAAFATPCPERHLERRVEDLRVHMLGPDDELDATVGDWEQPLPEDRGRRGHEDLLQRRVIDGCRQITFGRDDDHDLVRGAVLLELHDRYGARLWDGLDAWLDEVAGDGSLDERVRLGHGMALLAARAPGDVEQRYLSRWSAGNAQERTTAAFCLAWMSYDPDAAKDALDLALSWAERGDPHMAECAALALGTHLGSLFAEEAVRWLWFFSSSGRLAQRAARASLAHLLREACAGEDDAQALVRLSLLRRVARATAEADDRMRYHGARAAAFLLTVGEPDSAPLIAGDDDDLLPGALLDRFASAPATLAALWVLALDVGATRMTGVTALRRTLTLPEGLQRIDPRAVDLCARISRKLSPDQVRRLRRDLGPLWPPEADSVRTALPAPSPPRG